MELFLSLWEGSKLKVGDYKIEDSNFFSIKRGPSPLESWLAGAIDTSCKIENLDKAKMEKNIQWTSAVLYNVWGILRFYVDLRRWDNFQVSGPNLMLRFFSQHYQSETQNASGCIRMHQGAWIWPSTHQHTSSSPFSSNVVSVQVCGGASGWSLVRCKRGPSPDSRGSRVLQCAVVYLGRECRYSLRLWGGRQNVVPS